MTVFPRYANSRVWSERLFRANDESVSVKTFKTKTKKSGENLGKLVPFFASDAESPTKNIIQLKFIFHYVFSFS